MLGPRFETARIGWRACAGRNRVAAKNAFAMITCFMRYEIDIAL